MELLKLSRVTTFEFLWHCVSTVQIVSIIKANLQGARTHTELTSLALSAYPVTCQPVCPHTESARLRPRGEMSDRNSSY